MRDLVPHLDLIVVAVIMFSLSLLLVYRFLQALARIARALEEDRKNVSIGTYALLAVTKPPGGGPHLEHVEELLRELAGKMETQIAELSLKLKRDVNRIDRTIERNAVRSKRDPGSIDKGSPPPHPSLKPAPSPPPPIPWNAGVVRDNPVGLFYHCGVCQWTGELARTDAEDMNRTLCPECGSEIPDEPLIHPRRPT